MADYIEREAVKRLINIDHGGYLDAIDCIPAADVVPVVHCRHCRNVKLLGGREVGLRATGKDDFCNYGERKNDER